MADVETSDGKDWFQALVEHVEDWILVLDAEMIIRYANPSIERLLGYPREEGLGRSILKLVHPEDRPGMQAVLEDLLRRPGGNAQVEARWQREDGSWRTVDAVGRNLMDEPGVGALVFSARDVTARQRVEAALRESQLRYQLVRYQLVAQAIQPAIWDWDLAADRVAWDEGVQALFGYTPAEVGSGAAWWIGHLHPDDREHVVAGIQAALRSGQATWSAEYSYRHRGGTYVPVADYAYISRDPAGRATRMTGAMFDLTARKQAEAADRQLARLEGALLAARTAEHALNNQLALTVGYADMLATDPRLPPDLFELVQEALHGAQAAVATLAQLQEITRLEEVDQAGPGPILDLAGSSHPTSRESRQHEHPASRPSTG